MEDQAVTKLNAAKRLDNPEVIKIGPHKVTETLPKRLRQSATKLLDFYKFDEEQAKLGANKSKDEHKTWETQAYLSSDNKEIIAHVSPRNSSYVLTQRGFFNAIKNLIPGMKTNAVIKNLKARNIADLGAAGEREDPLNGQRMNALTTAGVVSYVVIHRANEKGVFDKKADLTIPVFNLHKMLEHLKKYPPVGIKKGKGLEQFQADINELEADDKLQHMYFIDQVITNPDSKDKYASKEELRKAIQCATDIINKDKEAEVLVSGDLVGDGKPEAQSENLELSVVDYKKPVIHTGGKVEIANQKLTIVRHKDRKDEPLPVEHLNRVLSWHHLLPVPDTRKLDHSPETMKALNQAHGFNENALREFNSEITATDADTEDKTNSEDKT